MALRALLLFFCTLGVFQKGLTDLIRTQQTVIAAVGDEVLLNCQLLQHEDVVKVIWWKILIKGMKNLISYHKKYGLRVNPAFKDKIGFTDVGLQNSSIFIRNVTEEDEGCYLCLFNIHPGDDLNATTCLQVYELHEPVLHVGASGSEETVVSCSATGRPAPTVTLTFPRDDVYFSETSSVHVPNTNGTVTVTSTAVLTRLHDMDTEVRCAVRVLSAAQKEEVRIIPAEVKQSAEGSSSITIIIIVFSVVAVGCVAVIITVLLIRKPWNSLSLRDPEGRKTPKKPNKNTEERNQTPLMQRVNELIRRMTPGKKKESDSPKVSSSPTGTNTQPSEMKTPSAQHEIEQARLRMSTGRKEEKASSKVSTSKKGINRQLF
ncbi:OX-2 membrane glycoprotein-like [Acanthopagrus latus]|uniref:OX-2 membrane glycoprotein-like n=1 Tax=Acanthopagrus latus TaxID=8177 RepID=UPI00187BEAD2|nr:OX-2 membrane glycoprotein-like [Acanthopagrus latus]